MSGPAPQRRAFSYLALRRALGVIGILLPFVLVLGNAFLRSVLLGSPEWRGWGLQNSMSAYYYTDMGNVFVGTLCVIGVFLLAYKGYDNKDARAGSIAGFCAVGVGLFPVQQPGGPITVIAGFHIFFSGVLYLTLAYFSLALFTRGKDAPGGRKVLRNRVYRICGWAILACLIGIVVVSIPAVSAHVGSYRPILWLESGATVAFGISWLTKGQKILHDADSNGLRVTQ